MQSARNLHVYAKALVLAKGTYALTASFPRDERFGLISQMRRAAVSVGSNIAEGCGRQDDRALATYLHIALGSASELEFQLELAMELGYAPAREAHEVSEQTRELKRMLSRLILAISQKGRTN